ncbi:hypothetical protein BD560DRAFT_406139 [Blakeslea trispora]|nr:hypothetical protein BD560DRAFT_406139 [Blakeslea trispora]
MNRFLYYICFLYLVLGAMGQESTQIDLSLPTSMPAIIPTELSGPISSLLNNPSLLSQASAHVSDLPSQFQSPAYSILAKATATKNPVSSKATEYPKPSDHIASFAYQSLHPVSMISMLVIITFIASLL